MSCNFNLEERVQRLERQNRLIKGLGSILALTLGSLFLLGQSPSNKPIPDELVAHSIRVASADGKNSAQLTSTSDGFVGLYFKDLNGTLRLGITMTPSGKPSVDFFDGKRTRLRLGVIDGKNGQEYSLALLDKDGQIIWGPSRANPY